jgi:alpha-amylase
VRTKLPRRPAVRGTALASLLGLVAASAVVVAGTPGTALAAPPGGGHDVIANLFEWNWGSVANECTTVLGPQGYGAVQVSPPEESASLPNNNPPHPWWEVYQPVSYNLTSRMGNRSQFIAMVNACHAAGVKVYADAVINHMTGQSGSGAGYGGTTFPDKYDYPGKYGYNDFHHYPQCPESDNQIHNYGVQADVQECELVQLADLNTETDYVRTQIAGYLNDLLSTGVDGFRVDAVKHINEADIAGIEAKLSKTTYIYQEVMYGAGEAVQPSMYESTGDLLEFRYGTNIKAKFTGNMADLVTYGFGQGWGMEPSTKAVSFVDNHDTDRNGSTLSYKDGQNYNLANVFMLAWNYGTPQVYSSFGFSTNDQSPPADSGGMVTNTDCANGWICEDRNQAVNGMVGWHNAVAGTSEGNTWTDGSNQVAFSRGSAGFVAIDREGGTLSRTFATGLPAGTYCDVIHGTVSGGTCSGPTVTVDGAGNASVTVNPMDAVAIDIASKVTQSSSTVAVTFDVNATTNFGQNVFVVGSIPALGNWNTGSAIALSSATYPVWSGTVTIPANTTFQYKYIKKNPDGSITWESDPNQSYTTGASGSVTLNDSWR